MKATPATATSSATPFHRDVLQSLSWNLAHSLVIPAREGRWNSPASLDLTAQALKLASTNPRGIFEHQELALRKIQEYHDTAITTGTGSGKSLVFHIAAIEALVRDSRACVLVLYPMRALAEEQHDRWVNALATSGTDARASLFIGEGLSPAQRLKEIASARVIVSTPDVVHAWLMQHRTHEKAIRSFLSRLQLLVIDEAHSYTAVFGSQSAFLFRRLDHAVRVLGHRFQVLAASATMADPVGHLRSLTGRDFEVIGAEHDSSPSHEKVIHFVKPTPGADLISGLGQWFRRCADANTGRFVAFVESRVQAEHFARGAGRRFAIEEDADAEIPSPVETAKGLEVATGGAVHAYRSGYDATYRRELVADLRSGKIAGLVSTSALELGMDLPDLSLGFLVGAPRSATSLMQRLGRFGRHCPANVFIIADGTPGSAELFDAPESLLHLPLQTSTLYLDNPRIQYIHVLCHSREET
jgi:DEAD/DEAH box helicase domain-containing protein